MERKLYTIADRTFYQDELVFGQEVWLRDHVFRGKAVTALSSGQLMAMLQRDGMTFLSIILIEDGKTQADKVKAGWDAVCELNEWLNANVRPREVMEYVQDFFGVNPATNLWLLADATVLNHEEIGLPSVLSS